MKNLHFVRLFIEIFVQTAINSPFYFRFYRRMGAKTIFILKFLIMRKTPSIFHRQIFIIFLAPSKFRGTPGNFLTGVKFL